MLDAECELVGMFQLSLFLLFHPLLTPLVLHPPVDFIRNQGLERSNFLLKVTRIINSKLAIKTYLFVTNAHDHFKI